MKKLIATVALAALACGGCTKQQVDSVQNAIASGAPRLADDAIIVAQIESKFVGIDGDSAMHVAVSSHDGRVSLSGRVLSDKVARNYVMAARAVRGVKTVAVRLSIDPKLPKPTKETDDFTLAAVVRANLIAQAGVNGISVGVSAHDGRVTLKGAVASAALHATLVAAAKATVGVRSVADELHVKS